jgi:ribonuclease HI
MNERIQDGQNRNKKGWWSLYTDGAAKGNPGPAGAGVVLYDDNNTLVCELGKSLGIATNNEAEYQGLILGLEEAERHGARRLNVHMDSELIVRQITGAYRVKNERLKLFYNRAKAMLQEFESYDIFHVRREFNAQADALASRAARRIAESRPPNDDYR